MRWHGPLRGDRPGRREGVAVPRTLCTRILYVDPGCTLPVERPMQLVSLRSVARLALWNEIGGVVRAIPRATNWTCVADFELHLCSVEGLAVTTGPREIDVDEDFAFTHAAIDAVVIGRPVNSADLSRRQWRPRSNSPLVIFSASVLGMVFRARRFVLAGLFGMRVGVLRRTRNCDRTAGRVRSSNLAFRS